MDGVPSDPDQTMSKTVAWPSSPLTESQLSGEVMEETPVSAETQYHSLNRPLLHSQDKNNKLFNFNNRDAMDADPTMSKSGSRAHIKVFLISSPDDEDVVPKFLDTVSWYSQNVIQIQPAFGPQAPTRRIRSGIAEYVFESIEKNDYTILLIGPTFTEEIKQTRDNSDDADNEILGNRCALFQLLNEAFLKGMDLSRVFPVLVNGAEKKHLPVWLKGEEYFKNGAERSGVECLVRKMIEQYQAEHSCSP